MYFLQRSNGAFTAAVLPAPLSGCVESAELGSASCHDAPCVSVTCLTTEAVRRPKVTSLYVTEAKPVSCVLTLASRQQVKVSEG